MSTSPASCRLLEAGGDVDGVSRYERLALASDDDLAGVHADPRLEPVGCHSFAHLPGRAYGAECIVLVRDGDAEDGHDRVADELLDRAAVALEDGAQVLEVPAHARAERLGVGRLAEARRADEVAEENGDDLPGLPLGSATASAPPQELQNRAPSGLSAPQCGQAVMGGV